MSDLFDDFWADGTAKLPPNRRESRYWTVAETALVLQLEPSAVRKTVNENRGLATHIGNRIKINRAAIREHYKRRSDPDSAEFPQRR